MLKGLFGSYEDVRQISDFWTWLETDFVDGIYEEEWYNEGTDEPFPCPDYGIVKGRVWCWLQQNKNKISKYFKFFMNNVFIHLKHQSIYMIPNVYTYDQIGKPCPISPKKRMILGANRLLGVPRLRLLRVQNRSCVVPEKFKDSIKVSLMVFNVCVMFNSFMLCGNISIYFVC